MKKVISMLLASAMLAGAAPAVISGEGAASLAAVSTAPAKFTDSEIVITESVSAAELLSYFADKTGLTVKSADGTELALTDRVSAGDTVTAGDQSLTVAIYGDTNADGKTNARDVISVMRSMLDKSATPSAAADLNADGSVNARDVIKLMRNLVGYTEPFGENSVYDEAGNSAVTLYFDSLMHRIGRSDTAIYGETTGLIRMAKNELEDAMMMIVTSEQFSDVTVEIGEMKNANGDVIEAQLFDMYAFSQTLFKKLLMGKGENVQDAVNQDDDYFADPLPRLEGTISLGKDESHGIMIQVKTTSETVPGYYSAELVLKDKDGAELKRTVLRTLVWDITLDDETASDTAFGFGWGAATNRKYKGDATEINKPEVIAESKQTDKVYMQFLMDNRISPYTLPVSITSPEADEYMSNPRVTSFCTLGGGQFRGDPYLANANADADMPRIYNKLRTNEDWMEKAYVYLIDEPGEDGVRQSKDVYEYMSRVVPEKDFHIVIPMAGNGSFTDNGKFYDFTDYVSQYTDILCPQSYAFTRYYTTSERREAIKNGITLYPKGSYIDRWTYAANYEAYGNRQFQERYDEYGENGLKLWWYICVSPSLPHANYFRYYQGAAQRVTLWQQYMFHSNGLLYWAMQEGWDKIRLNRMNINDGDGLLMYWGDLFGLADNAPVSSVRLEYIRDGIEDFQYMKQLEKYIDRDDIIKDYVNKVTTAVLAYSEDPNDIENTRVDLGFMLESMSK